MPFSSLRRRRRRRDLHGCQRPLSQWLLPSFPLPPGVSPCMQTSRGPPVHVWRTQSRGARGLQTSRKSGKLGFALARHYFVYEDGNAARQRRKSVHGRAGQYLLVKRRRAGCCTAAFQDFSSGTSFMRPADPLCETTTNRCAALAGYQCDVPSRHRDFSFFLSPDAPSRLSRHQPSRSRGLFTLAKRQAKPGLARRNFHEGGDEDDKIGGVVLKLAQQVKGKGLDRVMRCITNDYSLFVAFSFGSPSSGDGMRYLPFRDAEHKFAQIAHLIATQGDSLPFFDILWRYFGVRQLGISLMRLFELLEVQKWWKMFYSRTLIIAWNGTKNACKYRGSCYVRGCNDRGSIALFCWTYGDQVKVDSHFHGYKTKRLKYKGKSYRPIEC